MITLSDQNIEKPPATREDVENAKREIIARIVAMDRSVEGMRSQNSNEHKAMQSMLRWTHQNINRILDRFGFLTAKEPAPKEKPEKPGKPT